MEFTVEVAYPAPVSPPLDELLELTATDHDGEWVASGVGLPKEIAERDIEFHFDNETSARQFAQACEVIRSVRVLSVGPDDA